MRKTNKTKSSFGTKLAEFASKASEDNLAFDPLDGLQRMARNLKARGHGGVHIKNVIREKARGIFNSPPLSRTELNSRLKLEGITEITQDEWDAPPPSQ